MIRENLREVIDTIQKACERSGRDPGEVTLIAVSKTKPVEMIREVYDAGTHVFGENRPQELRDKAGQLPEDVSWHMIGHLQRNKVKYVVGNACMIHSVDSVRLAEAIDEEAGKKGIVMPVLIEVNMAGEESKFGVSPKETESLVRAVSTLPNIHVEGLMTIAPYTENPEENRVHFRNLRNLCVDIAAKNIDNVNMCRLSMGMTGDYAVAVEEGATLVRVGTGIFGARG